MARDSSRGTRSRTTGGGEPAPRKGFGGTNAGQGGQKSAKVSDNMKMVDFPVGGAFKALRIISDPVPDAVYRISIKKNNGEVIQLMKNPLNFDREADTFDTTKDCPYADIANPKTTGKYYYMNVIDRELQDNEPKRLPEPSATEKKTGYMDGIRSSSWTPVRVLRVTDRIAGKLRKLEDTNRVKTKSGVTVAALGDPEFGKDIMVSFDKDAKSAADMWDVQLDTGGHTPLSRAEQKYLQWNILEGLPKPESYAEAKKEAESLERKAPDAEEQEEEEAKSGRDYDRGSKRGSSRESDKPVRGSRSSRDEDTKADRPRRRSRDEDKPARTGKVKSSAKSTTSKTSSTKKKTRR